MVTQFQSRNNQGGPNRGKFNNNSPRPGFKPNSGGRFSSGGNAPPSGGAFQRRGSFGGGGRGAPGARGPPKVIVEPHRHAGVFIVRGKADALATKNMRPTQSVYGEKLIEIKDQGIEYRVWNPFRSKLASAIIGGVDEIHIKPGAKVLYLGAASGTTVSHVSDIIGETGRVYAVEFSKRVARDLLNLAQQRSNIVPIIADARKPIEYRMLVSMVDVIFADVAQPDQARIVAVNAEQFLKDSGAVVISIKASCIDSTAQPEAVFANEVNKLREYRIKPKEQITLEPYDRDHVVVIGHYRVKPKN
ncbi:MAG: hypothetical protein MHMPM18_000711 [Marteilia pararefringens]